jgi:hypothetical protein
MNASNSSIGDTNSRKGVQVAGIRVVTAAPLDQESPGSSPGGATEGQVSTWGADLAFLCLYMTAWEANGKRAVVSLRTVAIMAALVEQEQPGA